MTNYIAGGASGECSAQASARQTVSDWQGEKGTLVTRDNGVESTINYSAVVSGGSYTVHVSVSETSGATSVWVTTN